MSTTSKRSALITGVTRTRGIGLAIAEALASQDIDLFLHSYLAYDRAHGNASPQDGPQAIQDRLSSYPVRTELMDLDLVSPTAPEELMKAALTAFGHVDILILNHAYSTRQSIEELSAEEIDQHLLINVRASILLAKSFYNQHDGRDGGRLILMTSGQHLGPMSGELAYVASKGALHQMTASLADKFIEKRIRVNTVNPGPTLTWNPDEGELQYCLERMPLGRWGEPKDAGGLVGWLVSEQGGWISGQVINSEGGFRRG